MFDPPCHGYFLHLLHSHHLCLLFEAFLILNGGRWIVQGYGNFKMLKTSWSELLSASLEAETFRDRYLRRVEQRLSISCIKVSSRQDGVMRKSRGSVSSMANGGKVSHTASQFPTHNAPRVWLLTSGDSPVGISLARHVLSHGDYVVSGIIPAEFEKDGSRSEEFKKFLSEVGRRGGDGWKERLRIVALDIRCASPRQEYHQFVQPLYGQLGMTGR